MTTDVTNILPPEVADRLADRLAAFAIKQVWSVRDVARVTGLGERTIWRMEASGQFPKAQRRSAKMVYWVPRDVLMWLGVER